MKLHQQPSLIFLSILLFASIAAAAEHPRAVVPEYPDQPRFILSTDLSSDVDDAAAFGFLFEALQRGRGSLAACVTDSPVATAAPAARALLDAWGHESVPVGAYQGDSGDAREGSYARKVADAFGQKGKTRKQFPSDVEVLRRVYAAAPDRSIVLITIGFLNGVEGLMRSGPDEISPLDGKRLFEQKTAMVVSVGANFLGNPRGATRWNWKHAPAAAAFVLGNMTRPFYWLPANEIDQAGFPRDEVRHGDPDLVTGPETLGWDAAKNPIQLAFECAREVHPGLLADGLRRKAFDPAAVRFATDLDAKLFGFHHRDIHVSIHDGALQVDPDRSGVFSILRVALPTAENEGRDYLDAILGNLRPPAN